MHIAKCPEAEKCLELIHLVIDREASPEQEEYLRNHIEMCLLCLETYDLEKEIRTALKNRLEDKSVPGDLVDAIKNKISDLA